MQTDNNEADDERTENVNEAATKAATANCDDGSSTKVQSDVTEKTANDFADDKCVATVESPVQDKLDADNNECDVDEPANINDFGIVKEPANDMDSSIVEDTDLKRDDVLCNGVSEEKQIPNVGDGDGDDDNNIEVSTSNGEALTENTDSGDADINFDQIFDNLPENSTKSDSTNATPTENDVQPIETVPEVPEATAPVVETHETETNEGEQIEEEKGAAETEGNSEIVAKVNDISVEMSPEAEEELLKSPSMNEQCANVSTEYSESMLLKDDSKVGTTIVDEVDTVPAAIEAEFEAAIAEANNIITPTTTTPTESNELLTSDSIFDQLKAAEIAQESIQMESNKSEGDDIQEKCDSTDNNKDALDLGIDNDSNGSIVKESVNSPATSSVHSAPNIDESIGGSMDVSDNKENNLLEEMAGSPASVGNCMDGGSLSSARDADDNGFANSVIDLKDGNSNDARDGFDNDDKMSSSSCHEVMDQTSNSNDDKLSTKYLSNVSRSNEESSTGFTNEALLDLQDSIESNNLGAKSYGGNEDDDIVDTPDKSSESVIAIDDDDDDVDDEPSNKADGETKGTEEPPAKRMRIECVEGSDVPSIDENQKNEDVECTEKVLESSTIVESSPKEGNIIAVEPMESVSIENESDKNQATIEDDDDDIVIVESNESEQSSAAADTAPNATNSNKRPASPSPIDTADEDTRKKHKSDEDGVVVAAAPVAIVSDVTATVNKLDEQNDAIKTDVVKIDLDAVKKSSEEIAEEKASDVENLPKSPKIEDDSTVPLNEIKPVKSVELKVELNPKPEKCEKRSIALDFAAKFKKSLAEMSRKNLEEFVLVKITEAIVHKSEFSELKQKSDAQEQMIQASRVKLQEIGKQYRDLEMVYARLKKDLENKNQIIVSPIKITRAVGLQVSIQKDSAKAPPQKQAAQSNGVVTYSNAPIVRTIIRPDQATATMSNAQHQRLASTLASKQITHVQRQPVRPATTIRQVGPEQQRLTTTTGMEYGICSIRTAFDIYVCFVPQCNEG